MIRFAVIGTNWITQLFIAAAHETGQLQLTAVYSRSLAQAEAFSAAYSITRWFDSLEELAHAPDIDAVYIASPNACHCAHALLMMEQGKHVICEKPLASHWREVERLIACARKQQVVLFEAFKTAYLPNFGLVVEQLQQMGALRKAILGYCQYSSRYPAYLAGKNPNTFNPQMSNGSMMDIGYYALATMISLFGEPQSVQAEAILLDSGVDAHGSVIAQYAGFDVTLLHSKVSDSYIPSEIQGEEATLLIQKLSGMLGIERIERGQPAQDISLPQVENSMFYEAQIFAQLISRGSVEHEGLQRSLSIAKWLTEIRRQTGVIFPADKELSENL